MKKVFNPFTGLLDYTVSSISELTTKDHDLLSGLSDDDHTQYLLASGIRELTGDWNAGAFSITATNFISNIATGTQPYACDSTTLNTNLNADMLDNKHVGTSGDAIPLLNQDNSWSGLQSILEGSRICFGNTNEVNIFYLNNCWEFYINELITEIVFNSGMFDTDFRIAGRSDSLLFFVAASLDRIGIGTNAPTAYLHQKASTSTCATGRVPAGTAPSFLSTWEGDYWNDSTQKANIDFVAGIKQSRVGCIFTQYATVTVVSTSVETTLVGTGIGTVTLPANFFTVGKTVRITASGYYSTTQTAGQTLTIRIRLGGVAGTLVLATGANSTANIITNRAWRIIAEITCRTTGATGTVFAQGLFFKCTDAISAAIWNMVNTGTITINTTASQAIAVTADWNSAAATDTISCSNLMIEVLN
jgi:hypothetical protein